MDCCCMSVCCYYYYYYYYYYYCLLITYLQNISNYISEACNVSRVYAVAAVLR